MDQYSKCSYRSGLPVHERLSMIYSRQIGRKLITPESLHFCTRSAIKIDQEIIDRLDGPIYDAMVKYNTDQIYELPFPSISDSMREEIIFNFEVNAQEFDVPTHFGGNRDDVAPRSVFSNTLLYYIHHNIRATSDAAFNLREGFNGFFDVHDDDKNYSHFKVCLVFEYVNLFGFKLTIPTMGDRTYLSVRNAMQDIMTFLRIPFVSNDSILTLLLRCFHHTRTLTWVYQPSFPYRQTRLDDDAAQLQISFDICHNNPTFNLIRAAWLDIAPMLAYEGLEWDVYDIHTLTELTSYYEEWTIISAMMTSCSNMLDLTYRIFGTWMRKESVILLYNLAMISFHRTLLFEGEGFDYERIMKHFSGTSSGRKIPNCVLLGFDIPMPDEWLTDTKYISYFPFLDCYVSEELVFGFVEVKGGRYRVFDVVGSSTQVSRATFEKSPASLPSLKVSKSTHDCVICFDTVPVLALECNHKLCEGCYRTLVSYRGNTCPYCRAALVLHSDSEPHRLQYSFQVSDFVEVARRYNVDSTDFMLSMWEIFFDTLLPFSHSSQIVQMSMGFGNRELCEYANPEVVNFYLIYDRWSCVIPNDPSAVTQFLTKIFGICKLMDSRLLERVLKSFVDLVFPHPSMLRYKKVLLLPFLPMSSMLRFVPLDGGDIIADVRSPFPVYSEVYIATMPRLPVPSKKFYTFMVICSSNIVISLSFNSFCLNSVMIDNGTPDTFYGDSKGGSYSCLKLMNSIVLIRVYPECFRELPDVPLLRCEVGFRLE